MRDTKFGGIWKKNPFCLGKRLESLHSSFERTTIQINLCLSAHYKQKLEGEIGDRFLKESLVLKNSKNAALDWLMYCCGSPSTSAIRISNKIAKHLIQEMQGNG